ncbi:hypothetical protein EB14_02256 [Enterococcus faecium]|nr:hypothetical protein EB14_02256 [Enterococcus faecium]
MCGVLGSLSALARTWNASFGSSCGGIGLLFALGVLALLHCSCAFVVWSVRVLVFFLQYLGFHCFRGICSGVMACLEKQLGVVCFFSCLLGQLFDRRKRLFKLCPLLAFVLFLLGFAVLLGRWICSLYLCQVAGAVVVSLFHHAELFVLPWPYS